MSTVWTDATGKRWPLPEMSDGHLRRAISFMERTIAAGKAYIGRLEMFEGGSDPDGLDALTEQNRAKLLAAEKKLGALKAEEARREGTTP